MIWVLAGTPAGISKLVRGLSPLHLGKLEAALNNFAAAITVPFVVPYAVAIGADAGQVGLITALPLLAFNLVQIPAARWGARSSHPGACFIIVVYPASPLYFPEGPE